MCQNVIPTTYINSLWDFSIKSLETDYIVTLTNEQGRLQYVAHLARTV